MTAEEQAALQRFIESGHGWVGIHAAGLTGKQFIGTGAPYWLTSCMNAAPGAHA